MAQAMIAATKAEILAIKEMEIPVNVTRPVLALPKISCQVLKHPTFD